MIIEDPVYGRWKVEEVLGELIHSPPVQRLQKIHPGGAAHLVHSAWNVTRFEHSVGVMLLIRHLGGSLEEQVAGLLHDVSHTAFSHVVDIVVASPEEVFPRPIFRDPDPPVGDSRHSCKAQPSPGLHPGSLPLVPAGTIYSRSVCRPDRLHPERSVSLRSYGPTIHLMVSRSADR